ncbi:MAG: pilus assembly protein [Lachnospiraceae bacterium]|nr:pilus assembly protein [Lachnospiraceae bacterium]
MKKQLRKKDAGYFTVEAALVMPFVMLIITMMLFLAIYCYDRCVMEQCAYEAALRGSSNRYRENTLASQEAMNAAATLTEGKLFALKDLNYEVTVDMNRITVTYTAELNMPFVSWLVQEFGSQDFKLEVKREALRNRQVTLIRAFRKINDLFQVGEEPRED